MNKTELTYAIAEKANLTKAQAKAALEATLMTITEQLAEGNKVALIGFGTFDVTEKGARKGINPQTKQVIEIAARKVVKFKAGAELNDDMISIKPETLTVMTPDGGSLADYQFREAPYVIYRDGTYYFLWSVDDTGSPNYHVAYGTSKSPLGPIEVAASPVILSQKGNKIGTAHNSVLQIPGTDDWITVYHRINPTYKNDSPGIHREVCIDRLQFNPDGTIIPVTPQ